jgi:hypothetical protein
MNSRVIIIVTLVIAFAGIMLWNGCGKMTGEVNTNQPPTVRFVNVPVDSDSFNYAPIVYWIGDDPDGFVEYYSYIDDTTTAARQDPVSFIQNVDPSRWVDTVATQATIYLLTEEGDTTEHTFFIRATDDDGAHSVFNPSQHIRTYYRTNLAPNTPRIKWEQWPDDSFSTDNTIRDTLFCIDTTTTNWGGIGFVWKANDPDDRELNIIPLQFNYILVDADSNLIPRWSLPPNEFRDTKNLTIFGLPTGWYTLYVWSRDDGYTLSHEPGHISFYVISPAFRDPAQMRHILMYDETANTGLGNWPGDSVNAFYQDLLNSVPQEQLVPGARYVMDGLDVMFWDNSNLNNPLPYDLVHYFKLIIMYDEDKTDASGNTAAIDYRNKILSDYMDVGGNVWIIGRRMLVGTFACAQGTLIQSQLPSFLVNYFGLSGGTAANWPWPSITSIEFIGAFPASQDFPLLTVDTTRLAPPPFPQQIHAISDVDGLARRVPTGFSFSNYTFTTYYYNSIAAGSQDTVLNENSTVLTSGTDWPEPTTTSCFIRTLNGGLIEVYRVENVTKGVEGEVVRIYQNTEALHPGVNIVEVSYPVGEPWEATDVLSVDYRYNPYSASEFHLQPVGIFKMALDYQGNFLYRSAINSFPFYPLDNSQNQVRDLFTIMLNLFFSPYF